MERLIDADALKEAMNYNGGCGICFRYIDNADTINSIPVEWLKKIRDDDKLTIDDVETIDLILAWWQKEQEAQDG